MRLTVARFAATACVLALGFAAPLGCDAGEDERAADTRAAREKGTTGTGGTTEPAETTDPAEPVDIMEAGATAITVTGDWLAAGAGAVWLFDPPGSRIYRLHPESGELVATVRVPQEPCAATDVGFGALGRRLAEDPVSRGSIPPRIASPGTYASLLPRSTAAKRAPGPAGAPSGSSRTDPAANRAASRASTPAHSTSSPGVPVKPGSAAVRIGHGAVWVTNPARDLVEKIDPRGNRVVATTRVGPAPRFFAVGEGGVWTLNQDDGTITRLDAATGRVAATIPAEVTGPGGDMTTSGGSVWARGSGYLLTASIRARTGSWSDTGRHRAAAR
jgi:virginiamycin B lyase